MKPETTFRIVLTIFVTIAMIFDYFEKSAMVDIKYFLYVLIIVMTWTYFPHLVKKQDKKSPMIKTEK